MDLSILRGRLSSPRPWLLGSSILCLVAGAYGAIAHYSQWHYGNHAHAVGWLLAILLLLIALVPAPSRLRSAARSLSSRRVAFYLLCLVLFTLSRLWNFDTAPWNGNGLFDESGWDLWFFKTYVMERPFQPAWFHYPISRETLFHYYLWPFFEVFGFNILSYEAGLFAIWCTTFIFTLLLVDLYLRSLLVTAITALVFVFLPFSFVYTFAGYRYPMAVALCVVSLYFLVRGFRTASSLSLALGGVAAGLCLASSISGKQYLLALLLLPAIYACTDRSAARNAMKSGTAAIAAYGFVAGAMPILFYILFNRESYSLYEDSFLDIFLRAMLGNDSPNTAAHYWRSLWGCFFSNPGDRFFIPDALPIPLAYYPFLLAGFVVALQRKRYEIGLMALVPVAGAFVATCYDNRLLLAIPFWMILIAFGFQRLVTQESPAGARWLLRIGSACLLIAGLVHSARYTGAKTEDPFSVHHYAQEQVAVSRFLRNVVAGRQPPDPPALERDEFNRVEEPASVAYDTLICPSEAYSIIHLFLSDYDEERILSFCSGAPSYLMQPSDVWTANKKAIGAYVPHGKDLKLIWEHDRAANPVIQRFSTLRKLGKEDSLSFSFEGREKKFYALTIDADRIGELKRRVETLPAPSD
jgi:hypothetical protein